MSRTRHHSKVTEVEQTKRKKPSMKQRYFQALNIDEWYIELPITSHLGNKLVKQDRVLG